MNNKIRKETAIANLFGLTKQSHSLSYYSLKDLSFYKFGWRKAGAGKRRTKTISLKKIALLLNQVSKDYLEHFSPTSANSLFKNEVSKTSIFNLSFAKVEKQFLNYCKIRPYKAILNSEEKRKALSAYLENQEKTFSLFFEYAFLRLSNYINFTGDYQKVLQLSSDSIRIKFKLGETYKLLKQTSKENEKKSQSPNELLPLEEWEILFVKKLEEANNNLHFYSSLFTYPTDKEKVISSFDLVGQKERLSQLLNDTPIFADSAGSFAIHHEIKDLIRICRFGLHTLDNFKNDSQ